MLPGIGLTVGSVRSSAAASSAVLDGIANVAAAYGLRRLRSAYVGPVVRVRRSSDNAESDIGLDGSGEFDSATYSAFVGGGTGFVRWWYDQTGNGKDAGQATTANQPTLRLSAINSKPSLELDAVDDGLDTANAGLTGDRAVTFFAAFDSASTAPQTIVTITGSVAAGDGVGMLIDGAKWAAHYDGTTVLRFSAANANPHIATLRRIAGDIGDGTKFYIEGALQTLSTDDNITANFGNYPIRIGRWSNSAIRFGGYISEIIVMDAAISTTDHNTIGNDMATRFGLTWTNVS